MRKPEIVKVLERLEAQLECDKEDYDPNLTVALLIRLAEESEGHYDVNTIAAQTTHLTEECIQ